MLFGLIITLFSLMLVFAGFVYLLLDVAVAVTSSASNYSYHIGRGVFFILVLAVTAGIGASLLPGSA